MTKIETITINGVSYDAHTGLPIQTAAPVEAKATPARQHTPATHIHQKMQKSQTLNRKIVKKQMHIPTKPRQLDGIVKARKQPIARSNAISKFAPKPAVATTPLVDTPAQPHPVAQRVAATQRQAPHQEQRVVATTHKAPARVSQQKQSLSDVVTKTAPRREKKQKRSFRMPKLVNLASASLAIVLLAGYFTYINIPSISVRVAATQAGINASYPNYQPSGYRLDGPVAYDKGQVSMQFVATTGSQNFSISQQETQWDSSALLENYVHARSGENYVPHQKSGLTVYTFGNDAAWVNGGILYTINGNSQLSDDQILRIATSM